MDDQALARVFAGEAVPTPQRPEVDFRSLPRSEQRRRLVTLIEDGRSDEEIGRLFSMSQWQVRNLRYRLGIKKDRGGNVYLESPDRKGTGAAAGAGRAAGSETTAPFTVNLQGVYDGETLSRRLSGLRALLEAGAPERRYEVRLELAEVEPSPAGGRESA
ncbi:MAG TPA: hypothetical protein VF282_01990 [Bacillota bacterium]